LSIRLPGALQPTISAHTNAMSSVDKSKSTMDDIKYIEEAEEAVPAHIERVAEEKALVRKIDISLLPCIWVSRRRSPSPWTREKPGH
jgi:hypothetical protein